MEIHDEQQSKLSTKKVNFKKESNLGVVKPNCNTQIETTKHN